MNSSSYLIIITDKVLGQEMMLDLNRNGTDTEIDHNDTSSVASIFERWVRIGFKL